MKIEKGSRVKVAFISESATQFSGDEIKGFGVVDRCENGYVFGRLESGKPFMCLVSDCELVIKPNLGYEDWFINQEFYTNMRFIHGDNLFSKDGGVYRVLPVQMTYVAFSEQQSQIEQLEKEKAELQGRIRKATSKWIVVTSIATTQESGLPDTFYQKLEELRDALVGFKEASRGECE